jgi:catechol-2,3-dioxygenase
MPITRMNHAVLYVRDARRTERFYADVLGFRTITASPDGAYAFMRAPASDNHHDIAFFSIGDDGGPTQAGRQTVGLYHIAWQVATLDDLVAMRHRLSEAGALVGASDHGPSKSLYAQDPDGLEFEVMWLAPVETWGAEEHEAIIRPLDLDEARRRYAGTEA